MDDVSRQVNDSANAGQEITPSNFGIDEAATQTRDGAATTCETGGEPSAIADSLSSIEGQFRLRSETMTSENEAPTSLSV